MKNNSNGCFYELKIYCYEGSGVGLFAGVSVRSKRKERQK